MAPPGGCACAERPGGPRYHRVGGRTGGAERGPPVPSSCGARSGFRSLCEGCFRFGGKKKKEAAAAAEAAMPEIPLSRVVSVTSSDPRHPAENLLRPDGGGRWRGAAAGEKQISVVLELARGGPIHSLHIGNDGAAFVEVLVGTAAGGGDFQVLLPTAAFMSPGESRAGAEPRRARLFGPPALVRGVAGGGAWDRLRVVCSQPYCQTRPFGLSFIRVFAPPGDDEAPPPPEPPVRRLGQFTLREEGGGSPHRPPGALFYRRPSPQKAPPPQDPPGPSYAVATLQASTSPSPKVPKRRPPPKTNGTPQKQPKSPRKSSSSPPPPPPSPPPADLGGRGPSPVLGGVVLVLSGFENPLRSRLREAAVGLGAAYRPDWTPDSTHLVCAFPRTPKAARARALGGLLVGPAWVWDCQRRQRRLPEGPYLLDGSASSGSEGEGPDDAPPPPDPSPAHKAPPPPPSPTTSDPSGSESGGDDQSEEDPYGGSTEENSEGEGEGLPIPPLPDFFEDKTFFFHGEFPEGEGRRLLRYVIAFGGTLAPYMNDSVTHVVTAQDWDPAFEEALELRPSLTFVRPRWLLLCAQRQRALPPQPFAVVPRP